ncbi:Leucine-rich repeat-containing N-terminal, plant-type [Dillenia turbinata]|uniref:Leucine-rich repeat-containing N-terminal, plant-type n=1 Tax=Dillenia turbinata TaxID=194707 RepID=A0AAN8US34_9MAGN
MAVAHCHSGPLLFFFLSILFNILPVTFTGSESEALLKFKKSLNDPPALSPWEPGSTPCAKNKKWNGVICEHGIVTGVHLGSLGLSGNIDVQALLELPGLRTLSLINNSFSGPIPEFNRLGALKALYLTGNEYSGPIVANFFEKMQSLKKVWLSNNNFSGEVPSSLGKLENLMELHLENNQFSGQIPSLVQNSLKELYLSYNKLTGEIPNGMERFNKEAFAGNEGLCGEVIGKSCQVNASLGAGAGGGEGEQNGGKVSMAVVTTIVVILSVVLVMIIVMRRKSNDFEELEKEHGDEAVEVRISGSVRGQITGGGAGSIKKTNSSTKRGSNRSGSSRGGTGDLVVVNEEKGTFGMQDLMKAAAEVLGNGGLGSAYKALMNNGLYVVVKRMRELNRMGKDGFDAEIRRLGRLQHPNVLPPLAYHYRKDEKLLVYEYMPKGSLLYLLHGDRGPDHADLNWPARLRIVQGIAQGLNYLHQELTFLDLPHGNLKSSNILLTENYEAVLSDYGFSPLINTTHITQALFAYKSPEAQLHQVSAKSDVYCLGIVILEILTGKFPSQYFNNGKGGTDVVQWVYSAIADKREIEVLDPEIASSQYSIEDMKTLLHIGAMCADSNPNKRLEIKEVVSRIQELRVGGKDTESASLQSMPSLIDLSSG